MFTMIKMKQTPWTPSLLQKEKTLPQSLHQQVALLYPLFTGSPQLSIFMMKYLLQNVNFRKAHGLDNITSREMKVVNAEFSHCIANINRMSFTETAYPSKKKVGKVTTLFKSGGGEDFGNYQHLTMLSIPRKKKNRVDHMWILSPTLTICFAAEPVGLQKGPIFWIIFIKEKRGLSIDNGKVIETIFIDFRKAFDSVDNNS